MKPLSLIIALPLMAIAASTVSTTKTVAWRWLPDPADLGGMTTNDYYTNIFFTLYSVTNCTIPTNQWPVVATFQAASTVQGTNGWWTNSITIDGLARFYLLKVGAANGQSPFSNQYVWVPVPAPGIIGSIGP